MNAILDTERLDEHFMSPSKGKRALGQVIEDVIEFVNEDAESKYAIVVGTDSEGNAPTLQSGSSTDFVSVVTVHRIGKHGRYFWKRISDIITYDHHDRMLKEAYYSLELAQKIVDQIRSKLPDRLYDFEIHLDIGHNGRTKTMIQEIVGLVTGSGFIAKIKPESYAANKVADRHVG